MRNALRHVEHLTMNGYSRLGVNLLLAVLIAFILADIAYFASGYLRQSAFHVAGAVFVAALASAVLAVEIFSISRDSSHVKRHIRRTKLERLAQRLVLSRMEEEESYARAEHMMDNLEKLKDDSIEHISGSITAKISEQGNASPQVDAKSSEKEGTDAAENEKNLSTTASHKNVGKTQDDPKKDLEQPSSQESDNKHADSVQNDSLPSGNLGNDACCRLRIDNLTQSASTESVKAFVQKFGEVSDIKIIRQGNKKKRRVSAVVDMKGIGAQDAVAKMNGQTFAGKILSVTAESV